MIVRSARTVVAWDVLERAHKIKFHRQYAPIVTMTLPENLATTQAEIWQSRRFCGSGMRNHEFPSGTKPPSDVCGGFSL